MDDDVARKAQLAYAIRAAMQERGLTQSDLSETLGRSSMTVGRWVRGETAPSVLDVEALANALGVKPEYLISPPPLPYYPLADYLIEATVESAVQEGARRAARRSGDSSEK